MNEVTFNKLNENATLPTSPHEGDVGWDLVASEDMVVLGGETKVVPTGVSVTMPKGSMYGMVCSRSGLAAKNDVFVLNAPGIIDNGYEGEIKIILRNANRVTTFKVKKGDRIAQIVFGYAAAVNSKPMSSASRSDGGLGSSGIGGH